MSSQPKPTRKLWLHNVKALQRTFNCNFKKKSVLTFNGQDRTPNKAMQEYRAVCYDWMKPVSFLPAWMLFGGCLRKKKKATKKKAKRWMGTAWLKWKSCFRVWMFTLPWNSSVTAKIPSVYFPLISDFAGQKLKMSLKTIRILSLRSLHFVIYLNKNKNKK